MRAALLYVWIDAIGANVEARSQLGLEVHVVDEQHTALLEETKRFWQARSKRQFTIEDARASVENVAGFFATLQRWSITTLASGSNPTPTKEAMCQRST